MADGANLPTETSSPGQAPSTPAETSDGSTYPLFIGFFVLGVVGGSLPEVATGGWPGTTGSMLLLACGGLACGVLGLGAAVPVAKYLTPMPESLRVAARQAARWMPAVAFCTLVVIVIGFVALPRGVAAFERWRYGCEHPVELRALTSPDSEAAFGEVADAYVRWTAERNGDCAEVSIHVFGAPFEGVRGARDSLRNGWPGTALRQWPRPDIWLADSTLDVDTTTAALGADAVVGIAERRVVARTPIVLGAPREHAEQLGSEDMTWAQLFAWADGNPDLSVLRPDPRRSAAGAAATTVLYTMAGVGGGNGDAGAVERRIDSPLPEPDLLCSLYPASFSDPSERRAAPTAVIVTEQALIAYNQGEFDAGCPAAQAPSLPEQLVALYPTDTVHLSREFVRFDWRDASGPQGEAAEEFGAWLTGPDGQQALLDARLRAAGRNPSDPISDRWGANDAGNPGVPLARADVGAALEAYAQARRPGWLLALLDTSGSMSQEVDNDSTRFDVAAEAVQGALDLMIGGDRFGLFSFPASEDDTGVTDRLVEIAAAGDDPEQRSRETQAALRSVRERIGGPTPLLDAIDESVRAVTGAGGDAERVTAVVVITDGNDSASQVQVDELERLLGQEGRPRLFAVTVGEASCQAGLNRLADASGGQCLTATFDNLDRTLYEIASGLWRGGG